MSEADGGETIQAKRQRFSGIPRACEACNVRKIRCDRSMPCSNCVAYKVLCQGPSSLSKKRSKPDPILDLEERMTAFEVRLRIVESQFSHHNTPAESTANEQRRGTSVTDDALDLYEGESSFSKQLLTTSHIAKTTSTGTAEMNSSISDLHALAETSSVSEDHRFFRIHAVQTPTPNKMPLPFAMVTEILHRIRERTPIFCYGYFLTDVLMIERLCLKAYNCSSITPGHIASVHGILYFLLKEFIATSDPLCEKYDFKMHMMSCEEGLKTSIESFEVLAVPGYLSILALAFGALKAQEDAKPFLFCTLISAAANQCRTMGYHRERTYENKRGSDANNSKRLFWSMYISDKTLSLLLGRASCLQDFDIDAKYPMVSTDPSRRAWDENFVMAIRMAHLQGRIFEKLYSPTALNAPSVQRAQIRDGLTSNMNKWRSQFTQINAAGVAYFDIWRISRQHWDVIYYSVLTTLLRVPTTSAIGSEISSECFSSARLGLESHLTCLSAWKSSNTLSGEDYADWILSYSSFTPFLVIFLRAISVADDDGDLELLDDVVRTLGNIRGSSKHSEKLYKICSILALLAKQLAGTQNRFSEAYHPQEDALHFGHDENIPSLLEPRAIEGWSGLDMTEYLHNWEAHDMDYVLASWANGRSTTLDM